MPNVSKILFPMIFADDSNIIINGKNITNLFATLNVELQKIVKWLCANKLSLNTEKTNYIIFNFRTKGFDKLHLNPFINISTITRVESAKCLGIIIDSKLN